MKAGAADIADLRLPPDDGAVARSLSDLESKLSAWTSAVARVQDYFAARWVEFSELERSVQTREQALLEREARQDAIAEAAGAMERTAAAAIRTAEPLVEEERDEAEARDAITAAPEPLREAPPERDDLEEIAKDEAVGRQAEMADAEAQRQAADEPADTAVDVPNGTDPTTPEGIEEMIEALEPEMANAIRQRLQACNGTRTVGELIAEYEDEMEEAETLLMSLEPEKAKAVRVRYRLFNGRKSIQDLVAEIESESTNTADKKKSWWKR